MPHECGCGDKNLAMAPWSVGKYAKRMATLHLGSEDQLLLNASTNNTVVGGSGFPVVFLNPAAAPAVVRVNLTSAETLTISDDDYIAVVNKGRALIPNNTVLQFQRVQVTPAAPTTPAHTKFTIDKAQFSGNDSNLLLDQTDTGPHGVTTAVSVDHLIITLQAFNNGDIVAGDVLRVARAHPASGTITETHFNFRVIASADHSTNTVTLTHALAGGAEAVGRDYLVQRNAKLVVKRQDFRNTSDSHVNYGVTIPNIIGFPEHKRCLCQVQSAWFYGVDSLLDPNAATDFGGFQQTPPLIGVELMGVNPQNVFSSNVGGQRSRQTATEATAPKVSNSMMVGYGLLEPIGINRYVNSGHDTSRNQRVAYGFKSFRPIVDDGVLISSPFGKGIRVRFVNMSSGETLVSGSLEGDASYNDAIQNNPTHLVMKLLFLDDDEVPNR